MYKEFIKLCSKTDSLKIDFYHNIRSRTFTLIIVLNLELGERTSVPLYEALSPTNGDV